MPPSSSLARTTCAATSGVHLGCLAAANHVGSVVVVAVFVVIAPRTLRPLNPQYYLGWSGGLLFYSLMETARLCGEDPGRCLVRCARRY